MITVTARKNFYATDHGSVKRGQSIDVSEASAKVMVAKGLAEYGSTKHDKDAPIAQNKMQPPSEPIPVPSTANDLGVGGAPQLKPQNTSTAPKRKDHRE